MGVPKNERSRLRARRERALERRRIDLGFWKLGWHPGFDRSQEGKIDVDHKIDQCNLEILRLELKL